MPRQQHAGTAVAIGCRNRRRSAQYPLPVGRIGFGPGWAGVERGTDKVHLDVVVHCARDECRVRDAERAARAYKDINRLALQLLEPGGVLFTFSCSGGISADLFHKILASARADAGVDGYIRERLGGAPDHSMTLEFPEGEYLMGLVVMRKP